jgi:hypothetical protein
MSTIMYAYAVIGLRIDSEKLYEEKVLPGCAEEEGKHERLVGRGGR